MKKLLFSLTLVFCLVMLVACGENETENITAIGDTTAVPTDSMDMEAVSNEDESQMPDTSSVSSIENAFLVPEYDYNEDKLIINNLSAGMVVSSYSFEVSQTPMLIQKTDQGVAMLSNQGASDVQNVGGIAIISGDSSADTMMYWLFDNELKLKKRYELTNAELIDGLEGYVFAISSDGKEVMYAIGDSLYRYTFENQNLEQVAADIGQTVYYGAIRYSGSGKYLAFYGDFADGNGTAYGVIDLENKRGNVFSADNFSATTLTVNGEYAAIADAVRPASMGGPSRTGNILFVDLAEQQGKQIGVESGEESGLVSVSEDGRFVVTCKGGDGPSGVLRVYQVSNGVKTAEQDYTMEVNCKPYDLLTQGGVAYAVLSTSRGSLLSPAISLN